MIHSMTAFARESADTEQGILTVGVVTKPFQFPEIDARIQSWLRRRDLLTALVGGKKFAEE